MTLHSYKWKLCLLLFVMLFFQANTQHVTWDEQKHLTWDKFTPVDYIDPNEDAKINLTMPYEFHTAGDSLFIKVTIFEDVAHSIVTKSKETDALLAHEQGHFDIEEIYARRLRKDLTLATFSTRTFQKTFKTICDNGIKQLDKAQEKYDKETNHSKNKEVQQQWLASIKKQLEEVKFYRDSIIRKRFTDAAPAAKNRTKPYRVE